MNTTYVREPFSKKSSGESLHLNAVRAVLPSAQANCQLFGEARLLLNNLKTETPLGCGHNGHVKGLGFR